MKKTLIHVPKSFQQIEQVKEYINDHDMGYEILHANSNSLQIYGNDKQTADFLSFIKKYNVLNPVSNSPAKLKSSNIVLKILPHIMARSPAYFTPVEISNIYNLAGNVATTHSRIAIIALGGGYRPSDLTAYWAFLGLTQTPVVNSVLIDGATNNPSSGGDSIECYLDIEVAGGLNYNSTIDVYFAPNSYQGYYNAFYAAIHAGVYNSISTSWGNPESLWGASNLQIFNDLFQYAAEVMNVTICAASGDAGSSDGQSGLNVDFPASSPWVLGCGGTTLHCPTRNYGDPSTSETTWNNSANSSTGGGVSGTFNAPSYQSTALAINYPTQVKRGIPDISANANPQTGFVILVFGSYFIIGGTSAVSPLMAGYIASFKKGFILDKLYNSYNSTPLMVHDITVGSNSNVSSGGGSSGICGGVAIPPGPVYWRALTKYDLCTGLGTPNGSVLTGLINSY